MLTKIKEFLNTRNWIFAVSKNSDIITFNLKGINGAYQCIVDVREDFKTFLFVTFNGNSCPESKMPLILDFLNRLNTYLTYGNFEIDIESRQIKFRTSIIVNGFELNNQIIEEIIDRNIWLMDYTSPYFMKLMYSDMEVSDVYKLLIPSPTSEIEQ